MSNKDHHGSKFKSDAWVYVFLAVLAVATVAVCFLSLTRAHAPWVL